MVSQSTLADQLSLAWPFVLVTATLLHHAASCITLPVDGNGYGKTSRTFHILDGLPHDVVLGTGYLKAAGALINIHKGTLHFPLCPEAKTNLNFYSPPIELATTSCIACAAVSTFSMVTTRELGLPPNQGALIALTPPEPQVQSALEGHQLIVQSNPILQA